ncbi:MAG: Ketoisovalerate oxidoreductase subunit VorD [Methanomassiliicoccales archaeon PtaU1.Bin124]|nr:MAG: Ketoisovalerate oxidoreductase subunit VorD [Methanomassiliicoccales archaeon PtaU1.Bin124]
MTVKECKVQLEYTPDLVSVPITYRLARDLGLEINILKAAIDENGGKMILFLKGEERIVAEGLRSLEKARVRVKPLGDYVVKDDARCIDCGGCVSLCPMSAYVMSLDDYKVRLDQSKCVACGMCIDSCPRGAIALNQ